MKKIKKPDNIPLVLKWDICGDFHGMNDFGFANKDIREKTGDLYGRSHTYNGECYTVQKGQKCTRRYVCVRATPEENQ